MRNFYITVQSFRIELPAEGSEGWGTTILGINSETAHVLKISHSNRQAFADENLKDVFSKNY